MLAVRRQLADRTAKVVTHIVTVRSKSRWQKSLALFAASQ
jgi:hypothetical protein